MKRGKIVNMNGENIIITGRINVGKSSTMRAVLAMVPEKRYGYITEKIGTLIFINSVQGERKYQEDNVVALVDNRAFPAADKFNALGVKLLADIPPQSLVIMDEIGPIESKADLFCQRILELLDSDCTVLISMRNQATPWLDTVRNHPKSVVYEVTEDNRDNLYEEIYRNHFEK